MITKEHIQQIEHRLNTYEEIPKSELINYSKTLVQYYFNKNNFKKANNYILMIKDMDIKPSWFYRASLVTYYQTDVFNFIYGIDYFIELLSQYILAEEDQLEDLLNDLINYLIEKLSYHNDFNISDLSRSLNKLSKVLNEWSIDATAIEEKVSSAIESYQIRQLKLESDALVSLEITQLEKRKEALLLEIAELEDRKHELEMSFEKLNDPLDSFIQLDKIKITIIGASNVKTHHMDGILKKEGFNPKKATYINDYDKIKTYDISRLKTYDERHIILLGPTPHSAKGTLNYSSILTAIEHDEGYPKSFRVLTSSHELSITKMSLKSALSNVVQYIKSIDIN